MAVADGDGAAGGRITYTTKEILSDINRKLSESALITEQLDRRTTALENRVAGHDRLLTDELPKLTKFMQDFDVQRQVEDALDSRRVRGISNRDRLIGSIIGACLLLVTFIDLLPKAFGG